MKSISNYILPSKLHKIYKAFKNQDFILLDIGCFTESVKLIKKWLPKCKYHGVDIHNVSNNFFDQFYHLDLTKDDLSSIPNNFFDAALLSHIIEHIPNGLDVIQKLIPKLKSKGKIYIEFPSIRSLSFPHARNGMLNFCDDPGHIMLYDIKDIANVFLKNGCKICQAGKARRFIKIILFIMTIPYQIYHLIRHKKIRGGLLLWDAFGICDYVYAEKF